MVDSYKFMILGIKIKLADCQTHLWITGYVQENNLIKHLVIKYL